MIITCKKDVPFLWVCLSILPWATFYFNGAIVSVATVYSFKKFVDNPAGLTFILSLPQFISLLLVPVGNFVSDRIWTRFGRRKPFIVTAWIGVLACLALLPLMPNFWSMVAVYVLFGICNDIGQYGPMEPLLQEIVPPHQRGRTNGMAAWLGNLANMCFFFFALGRFDDMRFMAGVPISGESAIYWAGGVLLLVVALTLSLGIKETDQKSALRGERLSLRNFFTGLLNKDLWPVYTLVFGWAIFNSGLGALGNLLYTDQWHYTKQEMGFNIVVGGFLNMFILAGLAMIADKLNRMRAYQILMGMLLALNVCYYAYVYCVLPDHRPTLVEIIVFGETMSICGCLMYMVYVPLVYDYVRRNQMGTYMAGSAMLNRIVQVLTLNGVGLFVWAYAVLFQPLAGEMARVVLRNDSRKADVQSALQNASWTYPQDGSAAGAKALQAKAWYATGMALDHGRCWEIRLPNKNSEHLAADKETLEKELSPLISEEKAHHDQAEIYRLSNESAASAREAQAAATLKQRISELSAKVVKIDAELAARSAQFQKQVAGVFGDRVLNDGGQVLAAAKRDALYLEIATAQRPDAGRLEKILTDLRASHPTVIDLRPMKRDFGYGVALSVLMEAGANENAIAREVTADLEKAAGKRQPGLLKSGDAPLSATRQPAIAMKLAIVEEPLDTRISPITRVVNSILRVFDCAPSPDRRLSAIARSLRLPGETEHVRVDSEGRNESLISVVALIRSGAATAPADDAVGRRLSVLLAQSGGADTLGRARAFYDRIEKAAAAQRMTVLRPFVAVSYAPLQYDYMSGYVWIFLMAIVGIGITLMFERREQKGLIRKLGVEEAQAV